MSQPQYYPRLEVQDRYQASRSTIYRWIQQGLFPHPVHIGPRMVRWKLSDLEKFEQKRETSDE